MLRLFSWEVGVLGDVMDGNDQPYVGHHLSKHQIALRNVNGRPRKLSMAC